MIVFGDHTRSVKFINFPFIAGADGIKVVKPNESVLPNFLYYGTQYLVAKMPDKGYARHYQYLEKEDLSIPSIVEQHRIVSRIEELFSELDNSVSTLQKTKEQLAVYRQASITSAYPIMTEENTKRLSEISDITGGITKGRDLKKAKKEMFFIQKAATEINWDVELYGTKKSPIVFIRITYSEQG